MKFRRPLALLVLSSLVSVAHAQLVEQVVRPGDLGSGDFFGICMESDGQRFVAGAGVGIGFGAAYVYRVEAGNWIEEQKLTAFDGSSGDAFAADVSISGDVVVVGSPQQGIHGAAYVYRLQAGQWVLEQKLQASPAPSLGASFGSKVSVDGDRLVVSARLEDCSQQEERCGALYVFERDAGEWVQTQRIQPDILEEEDYLGFDVVLDGDTIAAGAFGTNGEIGFNQAGSAYVFRLLNGRWILEEGLGNGSVLDDNFGFSIDLEGDRLAIGAPSQCCDEITEGLVRIYGREGSSWTLESILHAPASLPGEDFGYAVQLRGDQVLIGAPDERLTALGSGAAYLFSRQAGEWFPDLRLVGQHTGEDGFGRSVAFSNSTLLVGAHLSDAPAQGGSVHSLRTGGDAVPYCYCTEGVPCSNPDGFGGCANSQGAGSSLLAYGSTSVASDDLVLRLLDMPPSKLGLLFVGTEAGSGTTGFGDGQLCIAAGPTGFFARFPIQAANAAGVLDAGPGLVAQSVAILDQAYHLTAGSTFHFQGWYRDPMSTCGSTYNSTNAVRVTFKP